MVQKVERQARERIDRTLASAGWAVCDATQVSPHAGRGVAIQGRQVLEYIDAYVIGLPAMPSRKTFGFIKQNLVMEYAHEQAVANGVNVNYDVYRIRTQVSEAGGRVESGYCVDLRDKLSRKVCWEQLDEEFAYDPEQLDRSVAAVDQIRTLVRTFRDKLFTEIFPGRTEVPKMLIFATEGMRYGEQKLISRIGTPALMSGAEA